MKKKLKIINQKIIKKLKLCIKTDQKIIKFGDTEIKEYKFHQYKSPTSINDIDVHKIILPNRFPFGKQDFKYFIVYKDSQKIRPLCIFRTQMITYIGNFDKNRRIYFLIKEEKVFIKYIWEF